MSENARQIFVSIPGEMRGKGRPRFSSFGGRPRAYTDAKTVSAENWVKSCGVDAMKGSAPILGPIDVHILIDVPIPASWSKKKRAEALAGQIMPTGKPDLDNSVKLICDALNRIVWEDDSQIVAMRAGKRYAAEASTALKVEQS